MTKTIADAVGLVGTGAWDYGKRDAMCPKVANSSHFCKQVHWLVVAPMMPLRNFFRLLFRIFRGCTDTMRLTDDQIMIIRQLASQIAGSQSRVRVFGSRLDDAARGGDIDLMLELPEPVDNPAFMAAQMSARVSRAMHGRKVDVLLSAPNLMRLPIHDIAFKEGQLL